MFVIQPESSKPHPLSLYLPFKNLILSSVRYPTYLPTDLFLHMCMCTYLPDLPDLLYVHTYICTLGKVDIICKMPR